MRIQSFPELDYRETRVLTFRFSDDLATGETLVSPSAEVSVHRGVDSGCASIVVGSPTVSGSDVLVEVSGMKADVDYHIKVVCTTSNSQKVLALAGILPVRSF